MFPTDVVILAGARTPFARYTGAFKDTSAIELGAGAAREAIRRGGADVVNLSRGNTWLWRKRWVSIATTPT